MAKDPIKQVTENDIRNVRFVYCDPSGVIRAKGTTGSQLAGKVDEGIGLTPGQNAGGWLKSMEDKATSIPLVGDVINSARRRGLTEFNAAAIERAWQWWPDQLLRRERARVAWRTRQCFEYFEAVAA